MPPFASIIVPCYNEQATIGTLLDAIYVQSYARTRLEVLIVDALSQDTTRDVISHFQHAHPDLSLKVLENEQRTIPAALNTAIAEARGDIIIRLDAHSIPIPEYVERCVEALEEGKGSNVGGVWLIQPAGSGWIPEAIAAAAGHPLAVGDASYRFGARAGAVDTVPFGAFRRGLIKEIGGFDESLLTNEDYEFNARIRRSGGIVWLDPQIRSTYIARGSLQALSRQYWRYGFWKYKMLRSYPDTLRWRQALPPVFVASLIVLAFLSLLWHPARWLLCIEIASYLVILASAGIKLAFDEQKSSLLPGFALAASTMHISWGCGFLWSLLSTSPKQND